MLAIADLVSMVAPLGIFFGRIANFINGELFGRATNVPWAIIFPRGGHVPRHPSQLYEALAEGIILFIIMLIAYSYRNKYRANGFLTGIFCLYYGIMRIICEFFREPDIQIGYLIGGITMGQLLSIPLIFIGTYLVIWHAKAFPSRFHKTLSSRK